MRSHQQPFGSDGKWEPALWAMIALSAALHAAAVLFVLLVPKQWFARPAPPLVSYTVDLVAPDQLGGTNLVEGGQGRTRGQTMAAAEPPPPPPPPQEQSEARVVQPPAPPKAEVVSKAEQRAEKQEDKAEALIPPTATREMPTRTPTRVALAVAKVPPTATPIPPEVEQQVRRAAEAEQARRQAEEAEKRRREEEAKRRVATAEAVKKAQAQATATAAAEAKQREQIEQRIVAAAKRMQEQAGERGAGSGGKRLGPPGAPLSVGPGQGAGGQVMGIDFVLYLGQLERKLKENWAWAGTNDALEAVVGFSILPDGKVVNVRILKSSGDWSFDLSVERTVRALDPMPPPPEAYRELFGDVQYTFNAKSMQQ